MGNQISRNVISIVYFLFYVGSAPNLLARNAIVLLFFFFYGLVIAMKSNKKFDAVILIPLLLFAVINFLSILKWCDNTYCKYAVCTWIQCVEQSAPHRRQGCA